MKHRWFVRLTYFRNIFFCTNHKMGQTHAKQACQKFGRDAPSIEGNGVPLTAVELLKILKLEHDIDEDGRKVLGSAAKKNNVIFALIDKPSNTVTCIGDSGHPTIPIITHYGGSSFFELDKSHPSQKTRRQRGQIRRHQAQQQARQKK
jgi:hypothetical protein